MKSLLALLAVILLGLGAVACGGSSKGKGSAGQVSSAAAKSGGPARSASTGATTTGGAAASGGGEEGGGRDNNIPAYGHAASVADRRAVTALVKRYYAAAAAADGRTACSLLYSPLADSVPEDYGQPPGPAYARGKTCAVVMSKVFRHVRAQQSAGDLAATVVTGVRIYRNRGFAELRSKAIPKGEIFLERQAGSWRVGALIGRERVGP